MIGRVITYKQKVNEKQDAKVNKVFVDGEDTWSDIIEDCLEAGKEVLGVKDKFAKKPENKEIKELSERKHRLKIKIQSSNNQDVRNKLKEEVKFTKKLINTKLKKIEEDDTTK